jgi:Cu(I)/Ag(I) efflux system membrane fusion protein
MRFLFVLLVACGTPATTGSKVVDPVPMVEPPPATSAYDGVLGAYEKVRAQLAADAGSSLAARQLAVEADKAKLPELSASAQKLSEAATLDAARAEFADVSKHVVALIAAHPDLARGRHVFECPMVKGHYNKWVQVSDDLANPYMGKAMLACGGESTWQ